MKELIAKKVKSLPFYGIIEYNRTKRFNDENFSSVENLFQYRLSKIHIYLGEKNKILGIQSFYKNLKNEEFPGQVGYNESIKESELKEFVIPSNDHLIGMKIYRNDDVGSKKLKFITKKGKELEVGEGGEDMILSELNEDKKNVILSLSGGYYDQLNLLGCKYINMSDYYGNSLGYFELRIKLRNESFKNKIDSNINKYKDTDKVLIKTCLLPESVFNGIIQFCMR